MHKNRVKIKNEMAPESHVTDTRNTRVDETSGDETSRRQRRTKESAVGGLGPERAVMPRNGNIRGLLDTFLTDYVNNARKSTAVP
jgi:hypothetical protein